MNNNKKQVTLVPNKLKAIKAIINSYSGKDSGLSNYTLIFEDGTRKSFMGHIHENLIKK